MTLGADLNADVADAVRAAEQLSPQIIAAREEMERLRQIPAGLSDALASAGLYRMYLPRALGGLELSPLLAFHAIEALAKADGSVGWCVLNANFPALFAAWLDPKVARGMFGDQPDFRAAGTLRPQGQAWPVEGGYRLKGQFNFLSGMRNATWLYCTSAVMDGDIPFLTPAGTPVTRAMWVPIGATTFLDTWSVMGLRGTGSHDCLIDDLFVPSCNSSSIGEPSFQDGPLYHPRGLFTLLFALFAANALGIGRGAINALTNMASREATLFSPVVLRERPFVQARVANAEAIISAARCYVIDSLTRVWDALCANEADPAIQIAHARLAITHAIHEAVRAVDLVFHTAGTNAIYTANPIERYFRDIHVAVQHNTAFPVHFESAGKVLLGLRPSEPGW